MALVKASGGNPVLSTATVILFVVLFNIFCASIEFLIFGERFVHWLDPIFTALFITYAGYVVWICGKYNAANELGERVESTVNIKVKTE